jgi:hypothetical protein
VKNFLWLKSIQGFCGSTSSEKISLPTKCQTIKNFCRISRILKKNFCQAPWKLIFLMSIFLRNISRINFNAYHFFSNFQILNFNPFKLSEYSKIFLQKAMVNQFFCSFQRCETEWSYKLIFLYSHTANPTKMFVVR